MKRIMITYFGSLAIKFFLVFHILVYGCIGTGHSITNRLFNIVIGLLMIVIVVMVQKSVIKQKVLEECDFKSYQEFLEMLAKIKAVRKNIRFCITMLEICLVLGDYDKFMQQYEQIACRKIQMSEKRKIYLQALYLEFLACTNDPALKNELKNSRNHINEEGRLSKKVRDKFEYMSSLRERIAEQEWKEAIELLEQRGVKTTFERVMKAYGLGKCYYHLGEESKATDELLRVIKFGGNTKYVALAKDILKKMDQPDLCSKALSFHQKKKMYIFPIVIVICLSILVALLNATDYIGTSAEEVYKRILCINKPEEMTIIHREEIEKYELNIIYAEGKVNYCLFEKVNNKKTVYRLIDFLQVNVNDIKIENFSNIALDETDIRFAKRASAEQHISYLIREFYKKNEIFLDSSFSITGVYGDSVIGHGVIKDSPISIEKVMEIDGFTLFVWKCNVPDLEKITYFDIHLDK